MPHGTLEVILANGRGLRDKDLFGKMDPFVELIVDSQKQTSKTHTDGGKNPYFNQTFTFNILAGCSTLQVEVWDRDTLSANDHIGGTTINLDLVAFPKGIHDDWFTIVTRSGKPAGQLHMCLSFKPRAPIQKPGHTAASQSSHAPSYVQPPGTHQPGYAPQPLPAHMNYPPHAQQVNYPPHAQQVIYPPQQGNYAPQHVNYSPTQQTNYPQAHANYAPQYPPHFSAYPNYPPNQPLNYPPQAHYPQQQYYPGVPANFPADPAKFPGYGCAYPGQYPQPPSQQNGYPSAGR